MKMILVMLFVPDNHLAEVDYFFNEILFLSFYV